MNQRKLVARWILSFACSTLIACNGGSGDTSDSGGTTGDRLGRQCRYGRQQRDRR